MALILAIEPDRRQASKLAMLARNYLHTEIVVTDSIGRALVMLDERLPDLILTSFQLPPKHRSALMDRMLAVDPAGTRVQTLVIPALGVPGCRASHHSGMPARLQGMRGNRSVADGCDPAVFGRQIAECLAGRVTAERQLAPAGEWTPAVSPMLAEPGAETPAASELPTPLAFTASHGRPRPEGLIAAPEPAPPSRLARPAWPDLLSAIRRDLAQMQAERAEPSEETTLTDALTPAPDTERPRQIRRRTAPAPAPDAWGVFNPQERAIAAVLANVDEGKTPLERRPPERR
jgi:hypothetical protein